MHTPNGRSPVISRKVFCGSAVSNVGFSLPWLSRATCPLSRTSWSSSATRFRAILALEPGSRATDLMLAQACRLHSYA
jgi:hypothetical protein